MAKLLDPISQSGFESYPRYLYRFIDGHKIDFIQDVLEKNSLYFALPMEFKENDALDSKSYEIVFESKKDAEAWLKEEAKLKNPHLSREKRRNLVKEKMRQYSSLDSQFYKERISNLNKIVKNGFDEDNVRILCLAGSNENGKMWEKYVNNKCGVCIKLDGHVIVHHLMTEPVSLSEESKHLSWFRNVDYVNKPIKISYRKYRDSDPGKLGVTLLYTKLKKYDFEKEWRVTIYECKNKKIQFPDQLVKKVIVGKNASDELISLIEQWNSIRSNPYEILKQN